MSSGVLNPVGVWSLVDSVEIDAKTGAVSRPRGNHPTGTIVYTAGGTMCAIVTAEGRTPLNGSAGSSDYTQQSSALFHSVNCYAGTYSIRESTITHNVQVASNPAWIGTEQVRKVRCDGDLMTIDATITLAGKPTTNVRLTWRRVE